MKESIPSEHIFTRIIHDQSHRPIIENNLRGVFAEYLIADALGDGWTVKEGSWNLWDIDGPAGERIEVKSSAYLQSWTQEAFQRKEYKPSPPSFDIAERDRDYWGRPIGASVRYAHAYVFAMHAEKDARIADQRRPEQWRFYVVASSHLPHGQKRIGLSSLSKLSDGVQWHQLAKRILGAVQVELKSGDIAKHGISVERLLTRVSE